MMESDTSTPANESSVNAVENVEIPACSIGDDGHFYSCMVCGFGGDLLCCDKCPHTYHLGCLDPPLKDVPTGEWLCPICRLNSQPDKSLSISKRKNIDEKSKKHRHLPQKVDEEDCSLHVKDEGESSLGETVDKILGCRVHGDKGTFSDSIQKVDVTDSPTENPGGTGEKIIIYKRSGKKMCKEPTGMDVQKGSPKSSIDLTCRSMDVPSNDIKESSHTVEGSMEVETAGASSSIAEKCIKVPTLSESAPSDQATVSYEFLVKWVGKSHIHNTWVPESKLKDLAKRKLHNYKAKYGLAKIYLCEERWKNPQRFIAVRPSGDGSDVVLVKWEGLPYDECSWEKIDDPVITKFRHLMDLYNKYELQVLKKDNAKSGDIRWLNCKKEKIVVLSEQPKELQGGQLFPHQLEALNWLRKCWQKSKNVILADEMGLGKTLSACAFISSLYNEFKVTLPCLVLVPLSTMGNWMNEFSGWAPGLNVVEYHGSAKARSLIREYEWKGTTRKTSSYKFDVLLTTYEMVLADSACLRKIPWEVLVVDEGHRLKNSESKLFTILNNFSFQHRVLITGTPLQNNIGEMFNLLHFLQPDLFPSQSSFEEKFSDLTSAEKVEELKKLVSPHMLRRLKKDVMQNIPLKTERMVPVELSPVQAEIYRAMLTKNYKILRSMGKGVEKQSQLNIIMQLRKVCNHPYLIPGTEPESGSIEFLHEMRIKASAKLSLLHLMLKALKKEGHRVLIFSQMTKLLDILEDYLAIEFGHGTYERVDGSVSISDRQAAINRFNQDKSRFVFLLSTRACGLGINLATADTVIIYDSDFNPHADIQAMNRAHRIGQTNKLIVYRLFVRASVEERILQLAQKKLMLDRLFISKSGSQKELEDILKWGTDELFKDISRKAVDEEDGDHSEHKRKRVGSLGDVYKDKCAEETNKSAWTLIDIKNLLDRSNNVSSSFDNAELESENDMLGSVKSVEWNDDSPDEQAGAVSTAIAMDMTCTQNDTMTEDRAIGSNEENVWDKLLQKRWKNYKDEQEEALGRGKRQRKTVYYKEVHVLDVAGTLKEDIVLDDSEPEEEEPVKQYSKAGRAFKSKYSKLRERQKKRLAMRKSEECGKVTAVQPGSAKDVALRVAKPDEEEPVKQYSKAGKALKEKYAMLRDRQKRKLATAHVHPPLLPILSNQWTDDELDRQKRRLATAHVQPPLLPILSNQWTDDELDRLWVGVRRHGLDWDAILRDPQLMLSSSKTRQQLSRRWEEEQMKALDGVNPPLPNDDHRRKCCSSSSSVGISERLIRAHTLQRSPSSAFRSYSLLGSSTVLPSSSTSSSTLTNLQALNLHNNRQLTSMNQIHPTPVLQGNEASLNRLASNLPHWLRPVILARISGNAASDHVEDDDLSEKTVSDHRG